MLSGYYPCTEAEAVELAAISMQVTQYNFFLACLVYPASVGASSSD